MIGHLDVSQGKNIIAQIFFTNRWQHLPELQDMRSEVLNGHRFEFQLFVELNFNDAKKLFYLTYLVFVNHVTCIRR